MRDSIPYFHLRYKSFFFRGQKIYVKKGDKDYEDKDTNISLIEKFKDSGQN